MSSHQEPFGVFIDPDTGVSSGHPISKRHIGLDAVAEIYDKVKPEYLICFDQSFSHGGTEAKRGKMQMKCDGMRRNGLQALYFDSHASFFSHPTIETPSVQ
jgi:hypothetical protein